MNEENETQLVYLNKVCSLEYYKKVNETPVQVLQDISLEIQKGEIWSFIGSSAFELRLLLEITANARAYQSGTCILERRGMMRKKRGILPHVYYIGSTNMLFDNMKVLEYMMYITAKDKQDVIERQKEILDKLVALKLDYICLSTIKELSPQERAIVSLFVALLTDSSIIVYNIARLQYDERGKEALKALCEEIKKQGKTLVFSTFDYETAQYISSHIACLHQGKLIYQGEVEAFINTWDHLCVVIEDLRLEEITNCIKKIFPMVHIQTKDHCIRIWDHTQSERLYESILQQLCRSKLYPQKIYQHHNCVENAWKEVSVHDL